ncbi:hypothetical protein JQC67_04785 [Aurantibacter crassamenti]|uniref:hypothetical protein n=1 Tax=Aurantibacter crassamenti TaxID=1837375 RepID=UPI00193A89C0|nr:hypothetical protein [Aurantibacter crassamenti]MBM1105453.1 hypothetical protein [Aurantibacter crassamenti]
MRYLIFLSIGLTLLSCKTTSKINSEAPQTEETFEQKNRASVTLLSRIQRLPGVILKNGVPVFTKSESSIQSNIEPLYILNGYAVGNSFESLTGLVESVNVKKIQALSNSDAAFYGVRGASGVIKILTYK